ncbi:cytochrome c oxidase subunit II [Alicyclobacillus fastidiosus]|uniref:Cytochrome c oxidase subunit II transmembrane domain-containing protein n=1 Tax=Alicyclobacillus fastidiosus TaxID=392011 RepID=A0ABV5AHC2_9BACL|nr:cytochrome c oxidase subunit II transmembrane domain-containing protein [Alicyclobacillus fastidiosus]WEH09226.1 cytochrome c oxidase subunit II transmembrane domain-containing protein [Alicyclobacillus fastidiosus]
MKPTGRRLRSLFLVVGLSMFALTGCNSAKYMPVLSPQGPVARSEYYLIIWSFALMMIVVLGVFVIFFYMIVKYRATPENKDYVPPEIEGNARWESIWTIIPLIIVIALAIPTVAVTYKLVKPPKAEASTSATQGASSNPLVIDVISERWKWVFKYPAQGIETVNYVNIPAGQPVDFELTSDGPMNTFWVPALGGMEFNMPGHDLKLWLEADHPGTYQGRSAQYSGRGFAAMTFDVNAQNSADFAKWVQTIKQTKPALTKQANNQLSTPGTVPKMAFSSVNPQ